MSKYWCFTLNNPEYYPIHHGGLDLNIRYVYYSVEKGSSGTVHLQGYVQLYRQQRLSWLRKKYLPRAHYEIARGSLEDNQRYIQGHKKDGFVAPEAGPYTYGEPTEVQQGRRSDLESVYSSVREGKNDYTLFNEHPNVMSKYYKAVAIYRALHEESLLEFGTFAARAPWQMQLISHLSADPSPRKVYWCYDLIGNSGKSYFANNWSPEDTYTLSPGKHEDIYYALSSVVNNIKVVFFDYPRDTEDRFPYPVLEKLKDGCFLSTKYVSRRVRFKPLHVVIFCNFPPDLGKLSADRWVVMNITDSSSRA